MGQFTHNGVVYEELPNGKVRPVAYSNPLAGATPVGGADPMKPLQVQGAQLGNQRDAAALQQAPLDAQGKALGNEQTAQQIKLGRSRDIAALGKQFGDEDAVKIYRQVLPNVAKAMAAPDTGAGDLSVIFSYVKSNDPIGAVKGEDTEQAKRLASLVDQWKAKFGMVKEGDRMPPQARQEMIQALRSTATQYEAGYAEAREHFSALAQEAGFPPELVIGRHEGGKYNNLERQFASSITSGETQTTRDPKSTAKLDDLIKSGAPFDQANKWVREQGGSPLNPRVYKQAVDFAKANPGYNGSLAEITRTTPTTPLQQFGGDTIGKLIGPGDIGYVKGFKGALDRAATLAEGGFNALGGNSTSARDAQQQTQDFFADKQVDPTGEMLGRLTGATVGAAPLRGAASAGALGNVLMTDSTGMGLAGDAAIGAAGGVVGDKVIRGISGMFAPQGREAMTRLNQQGVGFSPGQMIGGKARNIEDRLTANPVLGPKIEAMREQGLNAANRIPANRALGSIGQSLPENIPAGHQAVAYTKQQLGDFYDNTLAGQQIGLDPTYVSRLNALGMGSPLRAQEFDRAGEIIGREVGGAFQEPSTPLGTMSGRTYKKLDSRLGQLGTGFRGSQNVFERDIGDLLFGVKDQTRALARRQSPQMGDDLRAADEGYANFKILERAAASNPTSGIFSPGQLRTAIKASDRSVGKGATARGEARMQDLASDMSETMPSTVGSSGTSEREQVNKLAPWVMGSLMSPLYSDVSQQAIAQILLRQPGPNAERIANLMRSLPRGMFGGGAPLLIQSGSGN